jgi:hypothetical protein
MATTIFPTPASIVGVLADADVAFTGDGESKFIARSVMPFTNPRVERKGRFSGKSKFIELPSQSSKGF